MSIYAELKEIRKKWNLDRYALAQILKVDQQTIQRWEDNVSQPTADMLIKWADSLGCNIKLEFRK